MKPSIFLVLGPILSLSLSQQSLKKKSYEVGLIITSVLQMGKLRDREITHSSKVPQEKWSSSSLSPGRLAPETKISPTLSWCLTVLHTVGIIKKILNICTNFAVNILRVNFSWLLLQPWSPCIFSQNLFLKASSSALSSSSWTNFSIRLFSHAFILHIFDENRSVPALCQNLKLRMWKAKFFISFHTQSCWHTLNIGFIAFCLQSFSW